MAAFRAAASRAALAVRNNTLDASADFEPRRDGVKGTDKYGLDGVRGAKLSDTGEPLARAGDPLDRAGVGEALKGASNSPVEVKYAGTGEAKISTSGLGRALATDGDDGN